MAWINPKTDWVANPKNPVSSDMNRIEGNIEFLKQDIETKKGVIVDAVNNIGGSTLITKTHQQIADEINALKLSGNITASDMLSGKTGYSTNPKSKITGTIPSKDTATITPTTSAQTISAGQYLSGIQTIAGVTVPVANVLSGTTIAGASGTMPNRGAVTLTPKATDQAITQGYHSGSGKVAGDSNLISDNILQGKSIFGINGNVKPLSGNGLYIPNTGLYLDWQEGIYATNGVVPPTIVINDTNIILNLIDGNAGTGAVVTVVTKSPIDFTGKSKIVVVFNHNNSDASKITSVGVKTTKLTGKHGQPYIDYNTLFAKSISSKPSTPNLSVIVLDISSINGNHYVYLCREYGSNWLDTIHSVIIY